VGEGTGIFAKVNEELFISTILDFPWTELYVIAGLSFREERLVHWPKQLLIQREINLLIQVLLEK